MTSKIFRFSLHLKRLWISFVAISIFFIFSPSFAADSVNPKPPENAEFSKMSVDAAASFTLKFRDSDKTKFFEYFVSFFDRQLTKDEAQKFLDKIPPITKPEAKNLEDVILKTFDSEEGNVRFSEIGNQLCVFLDKKEIYIKAVFLTEKEKEILKNSTIMSKKTGRPPADFFSTNLESKLCSIFVDDPDSIFIYPRSLSKKKVAALKAKEGTKFSRKKVALFDLLRFAQSIRLYNTYEGKHLKKLDELSDKYIPDIKDFPDPWNRPYQFDAEKNVVYSTGPKGKSGSVKNKLSVPVIPTKKGKKRASTPAAVAKNDLENLAKEIKKFIAKMNRLPFTLSAFENKYKIDEKDRIDPWGAYYLMSDDEVAVYSLGPDGKSPWFDKSHPAETQKDDIAVSLKQ